MVSKKTASKGGRARADKLTPDQRVDIAKVAAATRWGAHLPHETHGGQLAIGGSEIGCAVLDNEQRILTIADVMEAFGSKKKSPNSGSPLANPYFPAFLANAAVAPFVSDELSSGFSSPLRYRTKRGQIAYAYDATMLPAMCEAVLDAERAGSLRANQQRLADAARVLHRGLARVGITALVDEATGYQDDRARDALAKILEKFVAKELRKWVSTFPAEFYKELFRLRGWTYHEDSLARPGIVAHYTNDLVYDRLAPGIREEIQRTIPRNAEGRPKGKMHSMPTENVGHPRLKEHLAALTALMRASPKWEAFMDLVDRAFPRFGTTRLLPMPLDGAPT